MSQRSGVHLAPKTFRTSWLICVAAIWTFWALRLLNTSPFGWFSSSDLSNTDYARSHPFGDIFRGVVFFFGYYSQPLGKLQFYLLYKVFGLNIAPWQLYRVALALAFSALLFVLVSRLSGSRGTALLAVAVAGLRAQLLLTYSDFSLLPEALAFAFFACAFLVHVRKGSIGFQVVLFIAAISSHEAALILPLALLAYQFTLGGRSLRAALPTGAVAAVFLIGKLSGLSIIEKPVTPSALFWPGDALATLTFAGGHLTPTLAGTALLVALALAAVLRNRLLIWAALMCLATTLPPLLFPVQDSPPLLFPLAAWGIFTAVLATDLLARIPAIPAAPAQAALVAVLSLLAAWPEVKASKRVFRDGPQKEQIMNKGAWDSLAFSAPRPWADKRIAALHHPFKTDSELRRLARLGSRDQIVLIQTASTALEKYDYVVDFYKGKFIRVRSSRIDHTAGHPVCTGVEPLGHSLHDDTDPRIAWIGTWTRTTEFPSAFSGTIAYSNSPSAGVCWNMEGTGFHYTYTKAFNRGIAAISVDGEPKAEVDLYSPTINWRSHTKVEGLKAGWHSVLIETTGRKSQLSSDSFIDLDAVEIF